MAAYDKQTLVDLVDGRLPMSKLIEMMRSAKDPERFDNLLEIWTQKLGWSEKILFPYAPHLFIVEKKNKSRVVKCTCGHEFGDYRNNWKLEALIYVRDSEEKYNEIYPKHMGPDPKWIELREYYCPGCQTLLDLEAVSPGYPVVFEFQPDLESFYRDWLGKTLD